MQAKKADVPAPALVEAVGNLIQADPARAVAIAASLRAPGRTIESTIEGMSMGQGLPPGTKIRIALIQRDRYEPGEVIAFLVANQVVVHRVMHRGRGGAASGLVLTRGDAPLVPDRPVAHKQILGPVTALLRDGRWSDLGAAPRRSLRRRIAASVVLWPAVAMLYVSPAATARMLALLHHLEGALRSA